MYGAAQKNRTIGYAFFAALFIYLVSTSQMMAFFAVNITVIFLLSLALRHANFQLFSGASILIYSVIIDIISFYMFALFPINVKLGQYVMAGIMFNLRSAIPAVALSAIVQAALVVRYFVRRRTKSARCAMLNTRPLKPLLQS